MAPSLKFSFPPKPDPDVLQRDGSLSDELVEGGWTEVKPYHLRPASAPRPASSSDMSLSVSNRSWLPRRPSIPPASTYPTPTGTLTGSCPPSPKPKFASVDPKPLGFAPKHGHNADSFTTKSSDSSPSPTTYESSHSAPIQSHFQQYSSSLPSRHRMGILSAASDALGFRKKIGSVSRRKQNLPSVSRSSNMIPEVIEINAHNDTTVTATVSGTTAHRDYEHEERERLRDVAAQSIGLDPELLHRSSRSASRSSLDSSQSPPEPTRMPPFPATLAALRPFMELSTTLPKFTPPSSLLVYALAKQWKLRTIVLTSHSTGQKTHVHLFKGPSKDEKEIERLEVNEDSVIFVADEEVGGRGHVVKFAGKDVSMKRSGATGEESVHAMWFLQIIDPVESQRWITAIKNKVLTQRAVRAGLDLPARMEGGSEPRGDMDVMLSMRMQGIISSHPAKPSTAISPPSPPVTSSPSPSPSLHSLRLNIPSPSPTTTMKGRFSGTRPRSPSVEGSPSLAYPPGHAEDSFGAAGTSLLTMLRTKSSADSGSSPSHSLSLPLPHVSGRGSPAPSLRSTHPPVVITASDLKISKERDVPELPTVVTEASPPATFPSPIIPLPPSLSRQGALTLSLQPPPRKYKQTIAVIPATALHEQRGMYQQASGNHSVAGNFGISSSSSGDVTPRGASPVSLDSSSFSGGKTGSFSPNSFDVPSPFVGEVQNDEESDEVALELSGNGIVNSSSPGNGSVSMDKPIQGTIVTKRWSRQGIPLPKQLTPPSGPPPSIPSSPEQNRRTSVESNRSMPATYAVDRSPSSSSSNFHSQTRISPRSGSSLSPTFWKRASSSSTYSTSSASTSDSQGRPQRPLPIRGESFPSSFGSVVGNGMSSRPMSMSIVGSSPVVHIGTSKRRSMPPPRPAPNFAPPPAPTILESAPEPDPLTLPSPAPQKSFRSSVAQRAMRLSLISPKPPPSSALPPRPDEVALTRNSSNDTPDPHPIPTLSSRPISVLSGNSSLMQPASPRSLSIRQRLRILSTPPASSSPVPSSSSLIPSVEVSTLDLSDDNDDDPPTPHVPSSQSFGLGEPITTMQNDPNFLQLEVPVTPTIPKPPPRSPFRPLPSSSGTMNGSSVSSFGPDCDFVALSPPPPRKGSRPQVVMVPQPEKLDVERSGSAEQESKLAALSSQGSVVSLGFVTT